MPTPSPTYAATVAHRLTTLMLVISIVAAAVTIEQAAFAGPRTVVFHAQAPVSGRKVPKAVRVSRQSTSFVVRHPSAHEQRLALAGDLLPLALLASVLWLLRGIARSVRDGDPFVAPNVRRLRTIGGLLIVGVLAVHYAGAAIGNALADPYTTSPSQRFSTQGLLPAGHGFPQIQLLCGLGALVLAQVFAHGVALREDVEATI
ncbi:MAG: hypothetical protein QOE11_869 [Solirubrobacteraceae bacterium]|nr:hypothetical protein [Solirubrobacteraceae bacterium]